ncbi:MAG TPA: ROK family protein [Candidatus Sulfotelmatobacter sp.]
MSHVFAVDLGGTKCSAAVVDRSGRLLSRRTVAVDHASPNAPVLQIIQLAEQFGVPKRAFQAAGVAVPGLVRSHGTVWAPNLPGWDRMPLASRLKRSLGIPVLVESDRNAAIVGESWRGAARGKSDAIVFMIGTGIGAGILSGGRVLRGAHELSGCAGWLTKTEAKNGASSGIGELEWLAAGPAIARVAQERLQAGEKSSLSQIDCSRITAHDVAAAARKADPLAVEIFRRAGTLLGYGIANMVSLLNPQVIILGGGLAAVSDLYLDSLRAAVLERAQPLSAAQVKVVVSRLGDKANLLGCARLAWDHAGKRA